MSKSQNKFPAAGPRGPGRKRVPRVAFGVLPNGIFRRDAGNCTRGRVRSPVPHRASLGHLEILFALALDN